MDDQVVFSPFTNDGEKGEVMAESKEESVRFLETRPSKIMGQAMRVVGFGGFGRVGICAGGKGPAGGGDGDLGGPWGDFGAACVSRASGRSAKRCMTKSPREQS
jgi:hypothetical protein